MLERTAERFGVLARADVLAALDRKGCHVVPLIRIFVVGLRRCRVRGRGVGVLGGDEVGEVGLAGAGETYEGELSEKTWRFYSTW